MLYYVTMFLIIALLGTVIGFGGIGAGAAELAAALLFFLAGLFVISLVAGYARRDRGRRTGPSVSSHT